MPASLLLLLSTACSDNILDTAGVDEPRTSVVTFTVNTESQTVSTRAAGEGEETATSIYHISDGTHVDVLKYAIYQVTTDDAGNETLTLDESFYKDKTIGQVKTGKGQRLLAATPDKFPMKISLSLDMDKTYKVAFWAQNSGTGAYDTQDLTQVKVNYAAAANNDELRDAFCALSDTIDKSSTANEVILRRPLAQVNVGTTGWDYEGAAMLKPSAVSYTQSEITLEGVAQYYDVLEGKALTKDDLTNRNIEDDATTKATFKYARIPAFINVSDDDWNEAEHKYEPFTKEEYLKVEINKEEGYEKYWGWDAYQEYIKAKNEDGTYKNEGLPDTETFKYLSMCYVLVPEAKPFTSEDKVDNATYGSVLPKVTFSAQGIDEDNAPGAEASGLGEVFQIPNVPVQKNWRTNILGNNFFFVDQKLNLTIVTDYCGDYNYNAADKKDDGNTPEVPEDKVFDIWFDDYSCGNTTQHALEPTNEFFTFLKHNYIQPIPKGPSWHKHDLQSNNNTKGTSTYNSVYDGRTVGRVLKMQGRTGIAVKVKEPSTLTIVQAISRPNSDPSIADAPLIFYKQKAGEELVDTALTGIKLLKASKELLKKNDDEFTNKAQTTEFISTLLNPTTSTANYSATIYSSAETIYGKPMKNNTDTNQDVIIHTIYIEEAGTYIIRNGGAQFGTIATESGLAYIKVQTGDHRIGVDWDLWQKDENPDYKGSEDNTGSSDPDGE